jgi:sugar lactone lactonase YvrE
VNLKRFPISRIFALLAIAAIAVCTSFPAHAQDQPQAYKWSVQYLIDNSQPVFGRSQKVYPRRNRGLALSPDRRFLYAGYHHSFNRLGEVRRIDLAEPDYEKATLTVLRGPLAKAITTDEDGRVYIADTSEILVYDATLGHLQLEIPADGAEGLAVTREGRDLVLYASERARGTINRWVLAKQGKQIVDATLAGFDGSGEFNVAGARSVRGIAIDSKGRIWIADLEGNKIFRLDRDGRTIESVKVQTPISLAFDGGKCLVTQAEQRQITILDDELHVTGTLAIPWEELELAPFGNNHQAALTGIVVVPGKGFYVTNEGGQTANQKSTYGREDQNTDFVNGKLYMDAFLDDNEPILHAAPVIATPAVVK